MVKISTITYNKLNDGVIAALEQAFPTIPVLENPPEPAAHPAYLYVQTTKGEQTKRLGGRYERMQTLVIQYSDETAGNRELHQVAEQLYELLEWIQVEDKPYQGSSMNHEILEGVLSFHLQFTFTVLRESPLWPTMENLEQKGGIKP